MSVFNAADVLLHAIESIVRQSLADFEFLIIDDGSTDDSRRILAGWEQRDSRIRVIRQSNSGLTIALERGCAEARGRWIARQDADDWSEPDRFEKSLSLAESHPDCVMVSGWAEIHGPAGESLGEVRRPADPRQATKELIHDRKGPPAHGGVMIRRDCYEAVGGYRRAFYFGQDSDLWLRMGNAGTIAYVQEVLYHYTLSPESISSRHGSLQRRFGDLGQACLAARLAGSPEEEFLAEAEVLAAQLRAGKLRGRRGALERANGNYHIGMRLRERGDSRAAGYFADAIRIWPLHVKAMIRLLEGSRQGR